MNGQCPKHEHLSRRALLKGALATTAGAAVANWGGLFHSQSIAAEANKRGKRCILLWMNGGASQIDTFDMKPGRASAASHRQQHPPPPPSTPARRCNVATRHGAYPPPLIWGAKTLTHPSGRCGSPHKHFLGQRQCG